MSTTKPSTGFWVIAVLALLWNLMGAFAFVGQVLMDENALDQLPEEQAELIASTPSWIIIVFGVATIAGVLASILLLSRKKLAIPLFLISLIAVLIQMGYSIFATQAYEVYGALQGLIMPILLIVIALFLYWYSKRSYVQGFIG